MFIYMHIYILIYIDCREYRWNCGVCIYIWYHIYENDIVTHKYNERQTVVISTIFISMIRSKNVRRLLYIRVYARIHLYNILYRSIILSILLMVIIIILWWWSPDILVNCLESSMWMPKSFPFLHKKRKYISTFCWNILLVVKR